MTGHASPVPGVSRKVVAELAGSQVPYLHELVPVREISSTI